MFSSTRKRETRASSAATTSNTNTAVASPVPEPTTKAGETNPSADDDRDYLGDDKEEMEDETTIAEQEAHEGKGDHSEEMDALQKEGRHMYMYLCVSVCTIMYMQLDVCSLAACVCTLTHLCVKCNH